LFHTHIHILFPFSPNSIRLDTYWRERMSLYTTILSTEDIEVDSIGRTPRIQSISSFPATSTSTSSSSHAQSGPHRGLKASKQTSLRSTEATSSGVSHSYERDSIDQEIHHHRPLGMSCLKNGRVIVLVFKISFLHNITSLYSFVEEWNGEPWHS
jgi:hypothetical protein